MRLDDNRNPAGECGRGSDPTVLVTEMRPVPGGFIMEIGDTFYIMLVLSRPIEDCIRRALLNAGKAFLAVIRLNCHRLLPVTSFSREDGIDAH